MMADNYSVHKGDVVEQGEKYTATIWVHQRPWQQKGSR